MIKNLPTYQKDDGSKGYLRLESGFTVHGMKGEPVLFDPSVFSGPQIQRQHCGGAKDSLGLEQQATPPC